MARKQDPFLTNYRTSFSAKSGPQRRASTLRDAQIKNIPPEWRVPVRAKTPTTTPKSPKPTLRDYAATAADVFFGDPRDTWSMYGDIGSAAADYLSRTTPREMATSAFNALKSEGRAIREAPVQESLNLLKGAFVDPITAPFEVASEAAALRAQGNEEGARRLASLAVPLAAMAAPGMGATGRAPRRALREGAEGAAERAAVQRIAEQVPKPAPKPATLNVGLLPSTRIGGDPVSPVEALARLEVDFGRRPTNVRRRISATEPTLVADIDKPLTPDEAHQFSEALRQDAISQRTGDLEGGLYGPLAEEWGGQFSPAYFWPQEGDTIGSQHMADLFRSGASRDDLAELAAKWGAQLDPAALDINTRLRDAAVAKGEDLPASLGQFTGREPDYDPAQLLAFREAQKRMAERALAERGQTEFGLRDLAPYLEQLPEEDVLQRTLSETQLPPVFLGDRALSRSGGRGVHISTQPGLEQADPSFYGTGHRGAEYAQTKRLGLPDRTYMYVGPEGTLSAEPEVLGVVGDEMRRGPRYAYEADLKDLYDVNEDPEKLRALAQAYNAPFYKPVLPENYLDNDLVAGSRGITADIATPDMERWIKERGYAGYLSDFGPAKAAALYGPTKVRPIGEVTDWRRKYAVGGRV